MNLYPIAIALLWKLYQVFYPILANLIFQIVSYFANRIMGKPPEHLTSGPGFNQQCCHVRRSFILATNAIHLITVVHPCLLGLT